MDTNDPHALRVLFNRERLAALVSLLRSQEFEVVAPVKRRGAAVYERIEAWEESGGDLFAGPPPAFSLKPWLHPAEARVFTAVPAEEGGGIEVHSAGLEHQPPRFAFVGVRSCDLAAVAKLDRVLLGDRFVDPVYAARRRGCILVAAACVRSGETCFCSSLGTGPRPAAGFDILLEELDAESMLATAGSADGETLLTELGAPRTTVAVPSPREFVQKRSVSMPGLKEELYHAFEHPRWEAAASRCLACTSCTGACPTCFCVSVEEASSLDGRSAWRNRRWDSCFTQSFTYIHGGSIRLSAKSRLRQRITHKFASWQDQFGEPGCTGCGRCIAWCPAGIDFTEEVAALRAPSSTGVSQ